MDRREGAIRRIGWEILHCMMRYGWVINDDDSSKKTLDNRSPAS